MPHLYNLSPCFLQFAVFNNARCSWGSRAVLWPKSSCTGCRVLLERQLWITENSPFFYNDFFEVKVFLENNYFMLMLTLHTRMLPDFLIQLLQKTSLLLFMGTLFLDAWNSLQDPPLTRNRERQLSCWTAPGFCPSYPHGSLWPLEELLSTSQCLCLWPGDRGWRNDQKEMCA